MPTTVAGSHPHDAHPAAPPTPPSWASPLWWSASRRVACAVALVAVLWLVIAWAVL